VCVCICLCVCVCVCVCVCGVCMWCGVCVYECMYVNCDVPSSELYRFVIYFEILTWNLPGRNGENYDKA